MIDEKQIENVRDQLVDSAFASTNIGNFAAIEEHGSEYFWTDKICYAALDRENSSYDEPLVVFIDWALANHESLNWSKDTYEQVYGYVDWVLNRSPWSICFRTKDAREVVERGAVLHTHFPSAAIIQGCIAIRMCKELPNRWAQTWNVLRSFNTENVAFLLCHYLEYLPQHKLLVARTVPAEGHMALQYELTAAQRKRFVQNDRTYWEDLPTFSQNTRYSPLKEIWGDEYGRYKNPYDAMPKYCVEVQITVFQRTIGINGWKIDDKNHMKVLSKLPEHLLRTRK